MDKLDRDNYESWALHMESVLQIKKLWQCIENYNVDPKDSEKNRDAIAFLRLGVSTSQLRHLKDIKTAREGWNNLKKAHQKTGPAHEIKLYRDLQKKCASVDELENHIERFLNTADKMEAVGASINNNVLVYMLLDSLPAAFANFEVAIATRDKLPSLDEIKLKVLEEKDRQQKRDELPAEQNQAQEQAWLARKFDNRKKQQYGNCFKCQKPGHWARNCPNAQTTKAGFLVCAYGNRTTSDDWVIDSGCTNHFIKESTALESNRQQISENVEVANGQSVTVTQRGTAVINTTKGELEMRESLVLPGLRRNLLSVNKATEAGNTVIMNKHSAKIVDESGQVLLTAKKREGLYVVNETGKRTSETALLSKSGTDNDTNLWHRRLGHLNFDDLHKLEVRNIVKGVTGTRNKSNDCVVCLRNKISEEPYPSEATNKAQAPLDRIHSDICGPFPTRALCGGRYFVTFIDEFTRFCSVYILKSRDEMASAFEQFKIFVEKQTGRSIKAVRTDGAKEYTGGRFAEIVRSSGIHHEKSVARCPQQNGLSERKNRTLVEMMRCLLDEAKFPDSLWAEAVQTANYIRNRCPTRALNEVTPSEMMWGIKPSLGHLRVFGCRAVSLAKDQLNKIHSKGIECKLIGYSSSQKGYRLIDRNRRVFVSRNVRFMPEEDQMPNSDIKFDNTIAKVKDNEVSPREYLPRQCKEGKRKLSPMKEEQAAKIKRDDASDEELNQMECEGLSAPEFKIGVGSEIQTPLSFSQAVASENAQLW